MHHTFKLLSLLSISLATPVFAGSLTLSSNDITQGEFMAKAQEFNGFGCSGGDLSPHLQWENAPQGTKSFAITAYDPDAPTGRLVALANCEYTCECKRIRKRDTTINNAPTGSTQINNDYGSRGFGGACPPVDHGVHHYRFTIHALSVEKLELPEDASGALAGYMINAHTIESSTIESLYKR